MPLREVSLAHGDRLREGPSVWVERDRASLNR
jgi:hypothetical protein